MPVTQRGGNDGAVSVSCAIEGVSATAGVDYTATTPQLLSWADGETATRSCTLTVIDDGADEGDESVNFTLSGATGGAPCRHFVGASGSRNGGSLPGGQAVAITDELQRRFRGVTVIQKPGQVARGAAKPTARCRPEEPGVLRVRAAVGSRIGQGSPFVGSHQLPFTDHVARQLLQ